MQVTVTEATIQGRSVPTHLLGELHETPFSDPRELRDVLDRDGYLLFRDVLGKSEVSAARAEVFERLAAIGEIASPVTDGIASGPSRRRDAAPDLGAFWKSVCEGPALRRVSHGPRLREIMAAVFGEPARPHDLIYLRPTAVGNATRPHYDYPFFAGRSDRIYTSWVPLGGAPVTDGPLMIVEGSNRFSDLIDPIRSVDYEVDRSSDVVQKAAYERVNAEHPIDLAEKRGSRLLTIDFQAGDLVVFTGFTLHGSLDNRSPVGRVRLSFDVRFQPASHPADDPRYFGPDPIGTKGAGYADMRAAQPLEAAG